MVTDYASLFIAGSSTTFSKKAPSFPKSNPYQALQKDGKLRSPAIVCLVAEFNDMKSELKILTHMMAPSPENTRLRVSSRLPQNETPIIRNHNMPARLFILISHSLYQILIILRSLKLRRKFEPKLINRTKKKSTSLRGNLNRCKELILFEALTAAVSVPI